MPDPAQNLAKAELRQLDSTFTHEIEQNTWCTVQFNPESLKVTFANQLVQPSGAGDQRGTPARQFVGAGTTKLTLTLWFDVGSPQPASGPMVDDVRKLTQRVAFFITPKPVTGQPSRYLPPAVRFAWGSFQFDGLMDSLEETLELFSPQGRPLRASLALSLSQQRIQFAFGQAANPTNDSGGGAGGAASTRGTQPLAQAVAGTTMQGLADRAGVADWQSMAAANGIENPRLLAPGTLVDLNPQTPAPPPEQDIGAIFVAASRASLGGGS